MSSIKDKKVVVNGSEEDPIQKVKLSLDIDWQKLVKDKQGQGSGAKKADDGIPRR